MKTLVVDLDGVVFDTIQTIVDLYNYDHIMYKDFEVVMASDVKSWDFDELDLESREYIDKYFNTPRFFKNLVLMKSASWILSKLQDDYKIIFCSSGSYANLQLKRIWINKHYPSAEFIPVELPIYKDKSHVDLKGAIFIDDVSKNLETSNAEVKICFGEIYDWNKNWEGVRCRNWEEVYQFLEDLKDEQD